MKNVLVRMDGAGRVVLPKPVREELALQPGDLLRVAVEGLAVTLTPRQENTGLVRRGKAFVFAPAGDEVLAAGAVDGFLEEERAGHQRLAAQGLTRSRPRR
jgi:AbrB family looped-hinge helix DNA binding protein